jgi:hypothetical protein
VLSKPEVYSRLANDFVGLRFDWEQGNHYKDRIGFILGTGDQLLLTPEGGLIRHHEPSKEGRSDAVYGRHGCDTTGKLLEKISGQFPRKSDDLKLDWFLWSQKPTHRPGGKYPASPEAIAAYARLPYVVINGPVPAALQDTRFLRWHLRQFIWVRGRVEGESELSVRRVKDGLKPGLPLELASIRPAEVSWKELGQAFDRAWMDYMKERPLTAHGYLDNQYGKWMQSVAFQMIEEEETLRKRATDGSLLPPGRTRGEPVPY